jgi:Tfp pilus assembly protein PilF
MRAVLVLTVAVALAGCASTRTDVPRHLFADASFLAIPKPRVDQDIFALSDGMRAFAETTLAAEVRRHGPQDGLRETLKRELRLEYDSGTTLPAAQTFDERAGNCLSLVILSASFAKHLGMTFTYQNVTGQEAWTRAEGIAFLSTHVNLKLGTPGISAPAIDFVETLGAQRTTERPVEEQTIRAMYFNNRAAEAIVSGNEGEAYWWAREAVEADPDYANGVNTLAVVYLRHGRMPEAERAVRHVLAREPVNGRAMTNLVRLLNRQGRTEEARQWQARLADLEPYPPFYFLDQGLAALSSGDYETARELLRRELRRMPYLDEAHFALAVADLRLGDQGEARKHFELALQYSTTRNRRDIYGAKLERFKALQVN